MHLMRYMHRDHLINRAWCCGEREYGGGGSSSYSCSWVFTDLQEMAHSCNFVSIRKRGLLKKPKRSLWWRSGIKSFHTFKICLACNKAQQASVFNHLWKTGRKMTCRAAASRLPQTFHASLSTDCKIKVTACPSVEAIVALQAKLHRNIELMFQWSIKRLWTRIHTSSAAPNLLSV